MGPAWCRVRESSFRTMSPVPVLLFVGALAILDVVVASDLTEKDKLAIEKCKEKTKAPDSVVEKFRKLEMDDSEEGKCFSKCILEEHGVLKEDGTIDNEPAEGFFKESYGDKAEKVMGIWKTCQDEETKGDDMCNYAYSLVHCFTEELKKEKIET